MFFKLDSFTLIGIDAVKVSVEVHIDAELGKKVCKELRRKVEVIGILLDPNEITKRYVEDMFGEDRVIACSSSELPQKLGNILRAIRGI